MAIDWRNRSNENSGGDQAAIRWVFPDNPDAPIKVEFGEVGHRLIRGMHRSLAALALAGNDVIIEHVLLYPEWRADLTEALDGIEAYMVGVQCSLDVIEERERVRGDRIVGQARGHYEAVHAGVVYDVEVDTSTGSLRAAAQRIAQRVAAQLPRAFAQMRNAKPG